MIRRFLMVPFLYLASVVDRALDIDWSMGDDD